MKGLVYHAGGLGDFVLSLPAIHRVAEALPGLEWRFWGPSGRLRLLLPGFGPAPPGLVRLGHTLWGERPAPGALGILDSCRAVLAFGGRAAPAWVRHVRGRVVALASFPPRGGAWVPVHQRDQLDRLGVPRAREPWLGAWRGRVLPARRPGWIVLHPGSGDPRKNLPQGTWVRVLDALRKETGLPAEVVVGPAEAERGGWEALGSAADAVTVCGEIGELIAVLARARLYLGNDSGPTHLAGILGIPAVAVFGPSDPGLWRPLGPRVAVVRTRAACAPCTWGGPIACPAPSCLEAVPAGDVVRAARAVMEPGP